MSPKPESSATMKTTNDDDASIEVSCEKVYGPYPPAIPIPFVQEDTPSIGTTTTTSASATAAVIDYRDVGTPDEWLPRDGRLVRLTGRHPFNVEPPLSVLRQTEFITPSSLHYVRNHGACPKLSWEEHSVCIGGPCVSMPMEFTMDQIVAMRPTRELPVTLVCAGNRRKEQNMMKQTIGFNWGPSGVSTNVWKGVLLRDLLLQAGVTEKNMKGKHVEMIGVEDLPNKAGAGPFPEEPWGKLVKYGTSIPLARAMNPAYDILIAYMANGELLQPDHGFPVRVIIPGYIGGRMIKWLKHINVIPHETRSHYHYHDNRILPPQVTAEIAMEHNWWYKPEYIFNELNINSAIASPDHNETLSIPKNIDKTYQLSGYAYTGGGRRITRVEVTTDGGCHWELAEIKQYERPTDYGMYWCWIWWSYSLPVSNLIGCQELMCRAWDEANNVQPLNPTWNLMGMGNNPAFRVKVHVDKTLRGEHVFRFEHPTQPGQQTGGWMTTLAGKPESAGYGKILLTAAAGDSSVPAPPPPIAAGKKYTLAEVAKHCTEEDVWIIVKDKVYDCTEYLELHPGGVDSIMINAGADATEDFVAIHSSKATKMLEKYYVGELDKASLLFAPQDMNPKELVDDKGNKLALNPKVKTIVTLQNKIVLSHDSILLDFALPTPQHILGLPTGKHMFFSAKINGETVLRRYTPISSNYDVGCVKFVIKAYKPCERFPEGGKMSQYLDSLDIGDTLEVRGPVGEFEYSADGNFTIEGHACHATHFNMIAGGTGITPVMQVAAEILRNPSDLTKMSLIFACREENDLLLRSTLDEWAMAFPTKFQVHYILSDSWSPDWKYSTGFVDKQLFEEYLHPPSDECYNLMCGPPIMITKGCEPNLATIGHAKSRMFSF